MSESADTLSVMDEYDPQDGRIGLPESRRGRFRRLAGDRLFRLQVAIWVVSDTGLVVLNVARGKADAVAWICVLLQMFQLVFLVASYRRVVLHRR